jgi:hypothetical protein
MLYNPKQQGQLERLAEELRMSSALTSELFNDLVANGCPRMAVLSRGGKGERLKRLIASGAWLDAAHALIDIELPGWQLRRCEYDDGEWMCSLSFERRLPIELDDTADAHHEVLPLAILAAFVEARRRVGDRCEPSVLDVKRGRGPAECAISCDNYR